MRKASSVLGIVGGAWSLLMALLCVIGGIVMMSFNYDGMWDFVRQFDVNIPFFGDQLFDWSFDFVGIIVIVVGILNAVCGVLGLIGGTMVKKNNVTAGVLMIVAAGVSLIISGNFISMVLFTLGGIFALVKEKPPVAPVQPPVNE